MRRDGEGSACLGDASRAATVLQAAARRRAQARRYRSPFYRAALRHRPFAVVQHARERAGVMSTECAV